MDLSGSAFISANLNANSIALLVITVPLFILIILIAFRGRLGKHEKLVRFALPLGLFASVTGVVIYFLIDAWESSGARDDVVVEAIQPSSLDERVTVVTESTKAGSAIFTPAYQVYLAEAGQKTVEVTFSLMNEGEKAVEIDRLVSGCECLLVEIDLNPVPPGEKALITGVFDTEKLRGQSERKITVQLKERSRPVFLTTRIETEPVYTITEEMTSWEIGGEPETKIVEFRVVREEPVRVLSAESKRKEMLCEVVVLEEGRAYDLRLTPDSTESSLLGIVRIETDCELENYARPLAYFSIQ